MKTALRLLPVLALALTFSGTLSAAVLWSDDFSADTVGNPPALDFTGSGTPDYAIYLGEGTTVLVNAAGNPANSMEIKDPSPTVGAQVKVTGLQWAAYSNVSGATTLKVSFDWKTLSSLSVGPSTQRFILTLDGSHSVTLGFGNVGGTNAFYAAPSTPTAPPNPSTANAIGWGGGGFNPGASFGPYDATNAAANATPGFVHFDLIYIAQATLLQVIETNGANVSKLTITDVTPAALSNAMESLTFISGSGGTSDTLIDNIVVSAEP